jgi:hypothetical protein
MPIDPRLLRVGVEVSGVMRYYTDLNIEASGTKFANANENECEVKISNLSKKVRDYILTETSPFIKSKTPKRIIIEAGRQSTGYSVVFVGDIISATPSQPPDIELSIKAQTGSTSKGDVVSKSSGEKTNLSFLAKEIAKDLGLILVFEAKDKKVSNFQFTGGKLKQVEELGRMGGVNAFIDDDKLIVQNSDVALNGKAQVLNKSTGMVGIPEITEHGIKVKYLYNNQSAIGGALIVESQINPAANGTYIIYKLSFDLANRQNSFYLTAEAKRV